MTKFLIIFLLLPVLAFAQVGGVSQSPDVIQEEDGSPKVYNPISKKYPNGTVIDNGDGTVSIDTSYVSGSGNYIEFIEHGEQIINKYDNQLDFAAMDGTVTEDQITFDFNYATAPIIYSAYKNGLIVSEPQLFIGVNQASDSYIFSLQPSMSMLPGIKFDQSSKEWQFTTDGQFWVTLSKDTTGGATSMQVQDEDGTPWTSPTVIKFTNGTVTNNGNGSVSVSIGGAGAPKGNNTTIQYNDGGVFEGVNTLTYTKGTQTVSARIMQITDSLYVLNTLKAEGMRIYALNFASGSMVYVGKSGELMTNSDLLFNGDTLSAPSISAGSGIENSITAPVMAIKNQLRIPYGTNPVALSSGQIAVDTSPLTGAAFQFYAGTMSYALMAIDSRGFPLLNPIDNERIPLWKIPSAIRVQNVYLLVTGGTSLVGRVEECNGNGESCAAIHADITGTAGTTEKDAGINDAYITMGNYLAWKTTTRTGVISSGTITIDFYRPPAN
ncbi:MAG: hypothetical protein PHQ22_10480 [Sulfuricurvum sp.]|nr:hypothetical protein [Sulfuricurvum sp.]